MTASKRPSALTWSATDLVSAALLRSPTATSVRPVTARCRSLARPALRACPTTSCPWLRSSVAAARPRPSADPVMNTRATMYPLSCRRTAPYRVDVISLGTADRAAPGVVVRCPRGAALAVAGVPGLDAVGDADPGRPHRARPAVCQADPAHRRHRGGLLVPLGRSVG